MKISLIERIFNIREKICFFPWNRLAKKYCLSRGVHFRDLASVLFFGRCWLFIDSISQVSIGKNFTCRSGPKYSFDNIFTSKIVVKSGATLHIGDNVGISNTLIHCNKSITIGDNVKIGGGCMIFDSNFHSTDYLTRRDSRTDISDAQTSPTQIMDDAFIGARCIIGKGVTIGKRSIIQAGSVVMRSIPDDCIAGGNPCIVIKPIKKN